MQKASAIMIILLTTLILFGCSSKETEIKKGENEKSDSIYIKGLPEKMSLGMRIFLSDYLTYNDTVIELKEESKVMAIEYAPGINKPDHMEYYQLPEEALKSLYTELSHSESPSSTFANLPEKTRNAYKPISPTEVSLPEVTMVDKEKLKLTTAKGSRTVDLEELSTGKPLSERVIIKLFDSTEEDFVLEVWDLNESDHILLFAKQDLSKITAVENDDKVLSEAYSAGKIADYATLLKPIGSEDIYEAFKTDPVIFNKKLKKTAYVEGFDILSNDAKQVLLGGEALEEGTQKIIGLESYLEGTKKNEKSFEIDGKAIARTAGLKETANLHSIDTLYMVEDFIVLRLTYNNYIADAGATNVLVDLSGNEPQMYVVDLGYKIGS